MLGPRRSGRRAVTVLAHLFGRTEARLLAAVVFGERFDLVVLEVLRHPGHHGVLALAGAVGLERLLEIVGMLTGQNRVLGQDADTVGAVTRDAGLRGFRCRADGVTCRLDLLARDVRRDGL